MKCPYSADRTTTICRRSLTRLLRCKTLITSIKLTTWHVNWIDRWSAMFCIVIGRRITKFWLILNTHLFRISKNISVNKSLGELIKVQCCQFRLWSIKFIRRITNLKLELMRWVIIGGKEAHLWYRLHHNFLIFKEIRMF